MGVTVSKSIDRLNVVVRDCIIAPARPASMVVAKGGEAEKTGTVEAKLPIAFMQPHRKAVGYFGAVNIGSGRSIHYRPEGTFNAETTWQFFHQLESLPLENGKVQAIILDNARYHHAFLHQEWRAEVEDHHRFVFLPPYDPELNPCERVWKLTRRLCTHNRLYPD